LSITQQWAISGPRATCGSPQRFQWPAEAIREKPYNHKISPTERNISAEANLN